MEVSSKVKLEAISWFNDGSYVDAWAILCSSEYTGDPVFEIDLYCWK
jgi:hypothetical protein